MKKILLILICAVTFSQMSFAQTSSGFMGVRRGVATVMLAGLGGAVLGLSTLSFYGEPQEHIGNIWTGLALGAVGGAAYILTQQNQNYTSAMALDPIPKTQTAKKTPPLLSYTWDF